MKLHIYAVAAALSLAAWSCSDSKADTKADDNSVAAQEQAEAMADTQSITDEDAAAQKAGDDLADAVATEASKAEKAVNEAVAKTEKKVADKAPKGGSVKDLTNDDLLRPGKKVSKLTILDFNATWCVPCKKFTPLFHEAAKVYGGSVDFYAVDVDNNPKTAEAFGVQSIPMVVIMRPDGTSRSFVGLEDIYPGTKFLDIVKAEYK